VKRQESNQTARAVASAHKAVRLGVDVRPVLFLFWKFDDGLECARSPVCLSVCQYLGCLCDDET
jgi:hypothetical protein